MSNRDQLRIQAVTASAHASESSSLVPEPSIPPRTPPRTPSRTLSNSIRTSTIDTPMTGSSQGPETGYEKVVEEWPIILAELAGHDCETDSKFLDDMFNGKVPSLERINTFLTTNDLYNNTTNRWSEIPEDTKLEKDLYQPLCNIFRAVLSYFEYSSTRTAIDSHGVALPHVEGTEGLTSTSTTLKSSPDIMIKGNGPNFGPDPKTKQKRQSKTATKKDQDTTATKKHSPEYWSCVTPVEVKTEANRRYSDNLSQIGVYVRQCFIQQKNRHFVYSLIVTESKAQLFHFDRSGVFHTIRINIHEEPAVFVRIVLGICSIDDGAVGFDTNIFWKDDTRYIKTLDENKREIKYSLSKSAALFYRRTIRGRGTICWKGVDSEGRAIIIKDAWRSRDCNSEWELLKEVKGLLGVGQMVAWEESGLTTSKLRGFDQEKLSAFLDFRDRIFCRITMEAYGQTIDHFQSREQFLYAFRDAIEGHRNLWEAGILHRDVSVNNVLIGKPDAEVGNRGVLIDLDLAIRLARTETLASVDFRTGTRAFQSISVLSSVNNATGQALAHDHLDDLESFFYLFCWITLGYDEPNRPILDDRRPQVLRRWDQNDARAAADSKTTMMFHLDEEVTSYFGPIFQRLLVALHAFHSPRILRKKKEKKDDAIPRKHLLDLTEPAKADYTTVLNCIGQAITDLESESLNGQYTISNPITPTRNTRPSAFRPTPSQSHSQSGSSLKRQAEELDFINDSPKSKRQRACVMQVPESSKVVYSSVQSTLLATQGLPCIGLIG